MSTDQEKIEFVVQKEIYKKFELNDTQKLKVSWSPDGSKLVVPGHTKLRVISREDLDNMKEVSGIEHESAISQTTWISENILVTLDINNTVKVWNYDSKTCISSTQLKADVTSMEYSNKLKVLAFFDNEGNLSICTKDFAADKSVTSTEKKIGALDIQKSVTKFDDDLADMISEDDDKVEKSKDVEMQDDSKDKNGDVKETLYYTATDKFQEQEKGQSDADLLIGAKPQAPMMPGTALDPEDPSYKMLCWNHVGSVALRDEMEMKCIEVDFADKNFHKNLITDDDINAEIATINTIGALIASRGEEVDLDQYEDDSNTMKYISQIKFIPFTSWNSIRSWSYNLPKGENADSLAIGDNWCAVATDSHYIRFFSIEGVQTFMMSYSCPIITMLAYEGFLCIISHNGLPMLESQNLRMKVIDVSKSYSKVIESEVPLSPGSNLNWAGFSEEGAIFTYDTDGVLRSFSFALGGNWVPVLDIQQKYDIEPEKFWIISVSEGDVKC